MLQGDMGETEAVELTRRDTRRYAKRQMTWFRKEPGVEWIGDTGETEGAFTAALRIIEEFEPERVEG